MEYKICAHCVMDTSDPDIQFDDDGVCSHCRSYKKKVAKQKRPIETRDRELSVLLDNIKTAGKSSEYDCIVGVSGGVDSSYVALLAKDYGLRTLLVHLDNGWNSDIAVQNIKSIAEHTGFDLYTHVIDWNEFKELQRSFFAASVVDIELLTDHAIKAVTYKMAAKFNISYMIHGGNVVTEAIMPKSWRHTKADKANILDIHKKFGKSRIKTYPMAGIVKQQYYKLIKKIKVVKILNYLDFDKTAVIKRLTEELGWKEYGGKHHESVFTRFYQGYILPKKFNIDKRKCHLSNLINAGQISRTEALTELEKDVYDNKLLEQDLEFTRKKLDYSSEEFKAYMDAPAVSHYQFKTDEKLIENLLKIRKLIQ